MIRAVGSLLSVVFIAMTGVFAFPTTAFGRPTPGAEDSVRRHVDTPTPRVAKTAATPRATETRQGGTNPSPERQPQRSTNAGPVHAPPPLAVGGFRTIATRLNEVFNAAGAQPEYADVRHNLALLTVIPDDAHAAEVVIAAAYHAGRDPYLTMAGALVAARRADGWNSAATLMRAAKAKVILDRQFGHYPGCEAVYKFVYDELAKYHDDPNYRPRGYAGSA